MIQKDSSMKMNFRTVLYWGLAALLLAACAPAAVPSEQPAAPVFVQPTATPFLPVEVTSGPSEVAVVLSTDTPAPTPFPVATSRGPNLEATDPRTVTLASGGLQIVEFFRFT